MISADLKNSTVLCMIYAGAPEKSTARYNQLVVHSCTIKYNSISKVQVKGHPKLEFQTIHRQFDNLAEVKLVNLLKMVGREGSEQEHR
ncbi:hypothetical protein OnM2_106027 [Erysiphe neolycopersici]|uniref:Uncharacterized protein n=1 Tax=Erysiphe neolycopersici TaxID=212602 RepID=A0A420H7E9_9PEZI|nr:hypothetical protein OnM2_106027 [Erysiphe neolycopersici]